MPLHAKGVGNTKVGQYVERFIANLTHCKYDVFHQMLLVSVKGMAFFC